MIGVNVGELGADKHTQKTKRGEEMTNCTQCKCETTPTASIVIKSVIEPETTIECPLCGRRFYMAEKTWSYLEGTTDPVCLFCAGPDLSSMIEVKAEHDASIYDAMETIWDDKLQHYRQRDPMLFVQVDAFVDAQEDDLIKVGPDGVAVMGNMDTWELMHGADVRVLIRANATVEEAGRGLASISEAVAGGMVDDALEKNIYAEALKVADAIWQRKKDTNNLPF